MKITLYNNFNEDNKLDKNIVKIIDLEGNLREASSLINPSILIELNPSNLIKSNVIDDNDNYIVYNGVKITWNNFIYNYVLSANYVFIEEFNRYYFITDIISVRNNMWRLNMHVDVLMSYKEEIKQQDAFVTRNEFTFDKMVKDDLISYYYDKEVNEFIPPKGDKVNKVFASNQSVLANNFVVNVINEDISVTLDTLTPPVDSLPVVYATTSGDSATSESYLTYATMINRLAKRVLADDTLSTFILSIMCFPFTLASTGSDFNLKLGTTTLDDTGSESNPHNDNVSVAFLKNHVSNYFVIADFTLTGDNFLDLEPYTQYEIFLPYLGWVTLQADNILNNRLIVYYVVNYQTGNSQVTIYDITNNKIIYTGNAQLGVKIPINSTNAREVNDTNMSNNIGLGVGLLTSAVAIIGGALTYNPVAIAGGVISGGASIAKYVQNQNTNYSKATGSVSSGQSGLYLSQDVKIRITRLKPKNYDEDYAKLYGKPLNKYVKIEELSGFTQVGNIHLENIGSITSNESDELYALLTEGIII